MRSAEVVFAAIVPLLLAPTLHAQLVEDWRIAHDASPLQSEVIHARAVDAHGNVYLAGHTRLASQTFTDPLLVTFDAAGQLRWQASFSGDPADDSAQAIAVDPADGSVYVASHRLLDGASNDVWIVKYDQNGSQVWAFDYDGRAHDRDYVGGGRLALDPAGNLYVPLHSFSLSYDILLVSFTPDGVLRWEQRYDGPLRLDDAPGDLLFDPSATPGAPNGRLLLAGRVDHVPAGHDSALLLAYTTDGVLLFERVLPTNALSTETDHVIVDADGTTFVCAQVLDPSFATDVRMWCFDASGAQRWTNLFSIGGVIGPGNIELDRRGGVIYAGTAQDTTNDLLVFRYDATGNLAWFLTDDDNLQEDFGAGLVVRSTGEIAVAEAQGQTNRVTLLAYSPDGAQVDRMKLSMPSVLYGVGLTADGDHGLVVSASMNQGTVSLDELFAMRLHQSWFSFCAGDGSEGACPCGNASPIGERRGCANSVGPGARLAASGIATLTQDRVVLTATGLPPSSASLLLEGDQAVAGTPFGDGLRCVGGVLRRLYAQPASSGTVVLPPAGELSISQRAAAAGDTILPGSPRYLQLYYRNAAAQFCPPATFNATPALGLIWSP